MLPDLRRPARETKELLSRPLLSLLWSDIHHAISIIVSVYTFYPHHTAWTAEGRVAGGTQRTHARARAGSLDVVELGLGRYTNSEGSGYNLEDGLQLDDGEDRLRR